MQNKTVDVAFDEFGFVLTGSKGRVDKKLDPIHQGAEAWNKLAGIRDQVLSLASSLPERTLTIKLDRSNMSLDLVTLGKRLREARENCAITQEQAAQAIGAPRTAIVHVEAGRRIPSALELSDLAELYKKPIAYFLSESSRPEQSASEGVKLHLRVEHAVRENPEVKSSIDRWLQIVHEGAELNELLGASAPEALPLYSQSHPKSLAEAFEQGESVAAQERKRLGLGENPVHMLQDLLSSVGAWVASVNLPKEISGMFLHERSIGAVILINNTHARVRRRFSYAHEYAHALIDREQDSTAMVSTQANAAERTEKRANAFAAAFLIPHRGVRTYLASLL